jgi:polynucleotide 5'-kinase involved in rRNA processing
MADQDAPQTAKEFNLKGFRNRLKKAFGRESQSTRPTRSNSPPADLAPTVSINRFEAAKLRATYTHFRILVIGRANAGKTTLLKRVCNTNDDPVYSEVRSMRFALYLTLIIPSEPTD